MLVLAVQLTTTNPTVDMNQTVTNTNGAADGGNFKITGAVEISDGILDINSGGGNIELREILQVLV